MILGGITWFWREKTGGGGSAITENPKGGIDENFVGEGIAKIIKIY